MKKRCHKCGRSPRDVPAGAAEIWIVLSDRIFCASCWLVDEAGITKRMNDDRRTP